MKISVALVDDEPYALSRIRRLIQKDQDFEVVVEVSGVEEGINQIEEKLPEILFLDIKMPDGTGFDLLSSLDQDYKPYVIFVTAYDEFALKAFEYHTIDYLLKPYENSRFYRVMEKAKEYITYKRSASINQKIADLTEIGQSPKKEQPPQIKISERGWEVYVDFPDIILFESNGNYCKIHLNHRFYLYKKTMKELEFLLNSYEFLRIHRSFIVNLNHVERVTYQGKNEYLFELSNGHKITSGRSYASGIKDQLSKDVLK